MHQYLPYWFTDELILLLGCQTAFLCHTLARPRLTRERTWPPWLPKTSLPEFKASRCRSSCVDDLFDILTGKIATIVLISSIFFMNNWDDLFNIFVKTIILGFRKFYKVIILNQIFLYRKIHDCEINNMIVFLVFLIFRNCWTFICNGLIGNHLS